jgi:dUTP pyrophosphatase
MFSVLKIKRVHSDATIPNRATPGSAGLDIYTLKKEVLIPGEITKIPTGLCLELPTNSYGRIAPRSSLSCKNIWINGGVIDEDFRGEVVVICINMSKETIEIGKGNKIAQLICESYYRPMVEVVNELSLTRRGNNGFGSSGM